MDDNLTFSHRNCLDTEWRKSAPLAQANAVTVRAELKAHIGVLTMRVFPEEGGAAIGVYRAPTTQEQIRTPLPQSGEPSLASCLARYGVSIDGVAIGAGAHRARITLWDVDKLKLVERAKELYGHIGDSEIRVRVSVEYEELHGLVRSTNDAGDPVYLYFPKAFYTLGGVVEEFHRYAASIQPQPYAYLSAGEGEGFVPEWDGYDLCNQHVELGVTYTPLQCLVGVVPGDNPIHELASEGVWGIYTLWAYNEVPHLIVHPNEKMIDAVCLKHMLFKRDSTLLNLSDRFNLSELMNAAVGETKQVNYASLQCIDEGYVERKMSWADWPSVGGKISTMTEELKEDYVIEGAERIWHQEKVRCAPEQEVGDE